MTCTFFLYIPPLFSCGRGPFLVLSAAGHAEGSPALTGQVWTPAGLQSRASWQVITGSLSASLGLAGQWKPHNSTLLLRCLLPLLLYHIFITPSPKLSSALLSGSHGTRYNSICSRVCALLPVDPGNRNQHMISRKVQPIGCCPGGRTICTHAPSVFQKQRHSHGTFYNSSGTTAVQQHQRFNIWPLWLPRCFCVRMHVQKCSREDTTNAVDRSYPVQFLFQ